MSVAETEKAPAAAGPTPAQSRIDALDALRGLAVMGIFVINIIGFSMPEIAMSNPHYAGGGALNDALWTASQIFVEGSMRGLFSLMFGAGIVLFTQRALYPDGPIRVADLYYRRTIWLALFGLAHGFALLMPGDILLIYGLAGLFAFPFRILAPRTLLIWAAVAMAYLLATLISEEYAEYEMGTEAIKLEGAQAAGQTLSEEDISKIEAWRDYSALPTDEDISNIIANRTGDVATVYATNAETVIEYNDTGGLLYWSVDALMMMMLGMAFFKWRIITAERSLKFYIMLAAICYAIAIPARCWMVWARWEADFSTILWVPWAIFQPVRVIMTIGHIGLFFTLWTFFASSLPMRALGAAGRMALSNYIGQTLICGLLFTGVGFGLYGSLGLATVYLIMAAVWVAQLTFSMWWLARFRFGPLEWGWRCLTYWRPHALRKPAAPADNQIAV